MISKRKLKKKINFEWKIFWKFSFIQNLVFTLWNIKFCKKFKKIVKKCSNFYYEKNLILTIFGNLVNIK